MARGIMAPVRERKEGAVARTDVNRNLVSSQMQAANFQSHWRAPDLGGLVKDVSDEVNKYYEAEKEAAFKRLDIEASKMQMQELEAIRVAESNEAIPEIENSFKQNLNTAFAQDNWGKQWLKERGDLFLAANSRDVMRAGISKQHELYTLEMNKTLGTWSDDIATSPEDKARVLMGDMGKMIDDSPILTPTEKQNTKSNALTLTMRKMADQNPEVALKMLNSDDMNWEGIDTARIRNLAEARMSVLAKKRKDNEFRAFISNPSYEGLEAIKLKYPDTKESVIKNLTNIFESSPNYKSDNAYEIIDDFTTELTEFNETQFADADEALEKAIEISDRLVRSNQRGNITPEETQSSLNDLWNVMQDEAVKSAWTEFSPYAKAFQSFTNFQINNLPTFLSEAAEGISSGINKKARLQAMAKAGMMEAMNRWRDGDIEGAKQTYNNTRLSMQAFMNPEIAGKKVGDTIVLQNSILGVIESMDGDDIVVKRVR